MKRNNKNILVGVLTFLLLLCICFGVLAIDGSFKSNSQGWTISTLKEYTDQRFTQIENSTALANAALEKRLDNTNEWRASYDDLARTKIARSEWEGGQIADQKQITELKERFDKMQNIKQGGNVVWAYLLSAVSLIVAVFSIRNNLIKK